MKKLLFLLLLSLMLSACSAYHTTTDPVLTSKAYIVDQKQKTLNCYVIKLETTINDRIETEFTEICK